MLQYCCVVRCDKIEEGRKRQEKKKKKKTELEIKIENGIEKRIRKESVIKIKI
jgi:hypothetical protein